MIIVTSVLAWAISQTIKIILKLVRSHHLDWHLVFASGGFPSAHSAFVTSLTLQIGFLEGWKSSLFAFAVGFWVVVIYDSFNVRRSVGEQAQALNRLQAEFAEEKGDSFKPIRVVLGHSPVQVLSGVLLGALVAWARIAWISFHYM